MKKVLILCSSIREHRYLPAIASAMDCEIILDEFHIGFFDSILSCINNHDKRSLDILSLIEDSIRRYEQIGIAGVTSPIAYPGMSVASVIADRLGLNAPSTDCVLLCEHKYYSRVAQQALVPDATPTFQLVDPTKPDRIPDAVGFPLFLKPVKSCFSINAHKVYSLSEYQKLVRTCLPPEGFLKPLNDLLKAYTQFEWDASYLLAESLLEGVEVSLEGYAHKGKVHILGLLDEIMYPGTMCFQSFQYPSQLSEDVQQRMTQIAEKFIGGIGYDNALFNMEFIYNPKTDTIHIIEVNPKMASQYPDLFEKVDGTSTYSILLALALGEDPNFLRRQGPFQIAASFTVRAFEDKTVLSVPSQEQIDELVSRFPDARIEVCATQGKKLSDMMFDGNSYRYCIINIGANSQEELEAKLDICKNSLNFQFG